MAVSKGLQEENMEKKTGTAMQIKFRQQRFSQN